MDIKDASGRSISLDFKELSREVLSSVIIEALESARDQQLPLSYRIGILALQCTPGLEILFNSEYFRNQILDSQHPD